jgi:hypothetical protein
VPLGGIGRTKGWSSRANFHACLAPPQHSRNETRRRARIRDQFEGLKAAINCDKKDRYNILGSTIEAVQQYQSRIVQLEQVIAKYEALTKQRFYVAPMALPSPQPQAKRARLEGNTRRRQKAEDTESEEEQASEDEDEEEEEDEKELQTAISASRSVGSVLSSQSVPAATVAVASGTSSQAASVLATLAIAATASTAESTSAGTNARVAKVAKKLEPRTHSDGATPGYATPSTTSSSSRKRKLQDGTVSGSSSVADQIKTESAGVASSMMMPVPGLTPAALAGYSPITGASALSGHLPGVGVGGMGLGYSPMQMMPNTGAWGYGMQPGQQQQLQNQQLQGQQLQNQQVKMQSQQQQQYLPTTYTPTPYFAAPQYFLPQPSGNFVAPQMTMNDWANMQQHQQQQQQTPQTTFNYSYPTPPPAFNSAVAAS